VNEDVTFILGMWKILWGYAMKDRLEKMLNVKILDLEELEDKVVVYVPEDQVRIAVGSGGAAVKAAELVIGKKIEVKAR